MISAESDSIGELAEALLHRKAPEALFMILTAYLDESGTHGPSPVSVMAGFVGEARQWRKFEKRAGKCVRRYGVDVCHAIDIKRGHNDFEGWSVDRKISFIDDMQHIVNETLELGYAVILKNADYESFYAKQDRPKKVIRDSKYGVLFRATIACLVEGIGRTDDWKKRVRGVQFVLESGHPNAGDAVRLFEYARANLSARAREALAGISFESKVKCLPLATADLLAYGAYQVETDGKKIGSPKSPLKCKASYRNNCYRHVIDHHELRGLYLQSLRFYEEKQKFGHRVKFASSAEASAAQSSET